MPRERLRIMFVASEVAPFAKTGGLADVASALPQALARLGHDVRVVLPCYREARSVAADCRIVVPRIAVTIGDRSVEGQVVESRLGGSVPVYLVVQDGYYDRPSLYTTADGDYGDNCERFVYLCRAALAMLPELGWRPQVIHGHDWQTGLLPVYLETLYRDAPDYRDIATLFTVHNLAYQGLFWQYDLRLTGLGWDLFTPAGIEFYGKIGLLKGGLVFADLLSTVSPTYAREIQTPESGEGLDGVLRERADDLTGILNGLDTDWWNPATDGDIAKRFSVDDLEGKAQCKLALRAEMGLDGEPDRGGPLRDPVGDRAGGSPGRPLVGVVGRLADQKGLDLVAAAVPTLLEAGGQLAVLGAGDAHYEELFAGLARTHAGRVAVRIGFDERLARRIYAGSDLFLMPSRYEPCGLGQLIALRYGSVPVVRRTGGLADTVTAWDGHAGTGFVFEDYSAEACRAALGQGLATYRDSTAWARVVRNGMTADFSWDASAHKYVTCYRKAIKKARRQA